MGFHMCPSSLIIIFSKEKKFGWLYRSLKTHYCKYILVKHTFPFVNPHTKLNSFHVVFPCSSLPFCIV